MNPYEYGYQTYSLVPFLVHLLWLGAVLWIASGIFKRLSSSNGKDRDGREKTEEKIALHILNERYAKGEINRQEYEEKKSDIGDRRGARMGF